MTGNGSEMVTDDGYHQYAAFELLMSLDKEIRKEVLGALGGVGGMNRPSIINHWYDGNDVPRPQATLERHQKRRAAEHPQRRVWGRSQNGLHDALGRPISRFGNMSW
jgi:hypothetical protein